MRTALVTGATRGTGRVLATALADAGWRVHALGRDRLVLDEMRASHRILPMHADLTDRDQLRALTDEIEVDVLVHAALRLPQASRFSEQTEADIDMALEVNLSATLHLSHALLGGLAARRGDLVIALPAGPGLLPRTLAAALTEFAAGLSAEFADAPRIHTLPCGPTPEVTARRLKLMLAANTTQDRTRNSTQ